MDEPLASEETGDQPAPNKSGPLSLLQSALLWISIWPTALGMFGVFSMWIGESGLPKSLKTVAFFCAVIFCWFGASLTWRFFKQGKFRAGVVVGALGWVYGPVYAVTAIVLVAAGAQCSDVDFDRALSPDSYEQQHLAEDTERAPSAYLPPPTQARPHVEPAAFDDCVDELYARHDANSKVDEAIRAMRSVSVNSAQALIYDVVVNVCLRHSESPVDDLGPYFGRSLHNAKVDRWKERRRYDQCALELDLFQPGDGSASMLELRTAMCRLDPEMSHILQLKAQGYTNGEIGERLDMSASLVGNRISDARDELSNLLERRRKHLR